MSEEVTGLYGRGWAFPPAFDSVAGVAMVADHEDIAQSLRILFLTQPGERIMRHAYGCDLSSLMFEIVNDDLLARITTEVTESILRYEQRVALEAVKVEQASRQPGKVAVAVVYRVRGADGMQRLQGAIDLTAGRGGLSLA